MNTSDYIAVEDKYGAHNYHPLDVVLNKGEGIWVYDVDGNKFMDCLSAYSAVNHGHCHPRLIKAMTTQAQEMTLTSRAFRNDKLGLFYQTLCELTGYEMTLPQDFGLALHVGHSFGDAYDVGPGAPAGENGLSDSYTDWSIGISKSVYGVDLGLTYVGSDGDDLTFNSIPGAIAFGDLADDRVVFSVSKSM